MGPAPGGAPAEPEGANRKTAWARGDGVMLRVATAEDLDDAGVQQALRDGVERGYLGALPEFPLGCEWYSIRADDERVGVIALTRDQVRREVTVHALAIVAAQRGHAYAAHALLAAERRLAIDGVRQFLARVPRGNGHGLYFMLRCGYAPIIPPPEEDGTTWFRRSEAAARVVVANEAGVSVAAPPARRGRAGGGGGRPVGTPS